MKRSLTAAAALLFPLCALSFAQAEEPRYEAGFKAGAGSYSYLDDRAGTRGVLGVEACFFCAGRYGLFAAYNHFLAPGRPSSYESADLLNLGLRIQGRGRVSPFFDVGFAAGNSRYAEYIRYTRSTTTAGAGLGAGVAFRTAKGLYIRPQVRVYVMSEAYVASSVEVAAGWRFGGSR
jgi:hypothetical protein